MQATDGHWTGGELDARARLMLAVARDAILGDPGLRLCEGLRLIEAMRTAVGRLGPAGPAVFDLHIRPHLRALLLNRFGICADPQHDLN